MKKIGFIFLAGFILSGCAVKEDNIEESKKPFIPINKEVVGWIDYKQDTDKDKVPDYKDKCPNTPFGAKVDANGCGIDSDKDGVIDFYDQCMHTIPGAKVDENGCALDDDKDGVPNIIDKCPHTPSNVKVDESGCALDTDKDGIPDYKDECLHTPKGAVIDKNGCAIDSDSDGIPDGIDKCPSTPFGMEVNLYGCPLDSDGDGVADNMDKCANTPKNVPVDNEGCPFDRDKDGIPDYKDKCPNTPPNTAVDSNGCTILKVFRFNFPTKSYTINKSYYPQIKKLADILKSHPNIKIEVQGHTDDRGTFKFNKILSLKRANALKEILVKTYHINPNRIVTVGYGYEKPIADNSTPEGRRLNRRVVVVDITDRRW